MIINDLYNNKKQGVAEGLGEYVPLAIFLGMLYTWYKNTKTKEPSFKVFINGKDVSTKLLTKAEAVHVIKNLAKQEHDTKTQYAIVDTKTNNIVFRRTWSDNPDITGGSPSWVDSNESANQGVAEGWKTNALSGAVVLGGIGAIAGSPIIGTVLGLALGNFLVKVGGYHNDYDENDNPHRYKVLINQRPVPSKKQLSKEEAISLIVKIAEKEFDRKTEYSIYDTEDDKIVFRQYWSDNAEDSGWKQIQHEGQQGVSEVSLGDYDKKAQLSRAMAQTNRFFDRDDAAKVAAADRTIANRTKGLDRADARVKPYTPPAQDAEKMQRDLTAKYPNIDELVAAAEQRRDPNYDYAEGDAYYRGREAEQNYQKLKQIQRVIQGLNESLNQSHLP